MLKVCTKYVFITLATVALTGCNGGGCFGLCDARDDDDELTPPPQGPDRSCYADSTLEPAELLTYVESDPTSAQELSLRPIASATMTELRPLLVWVTGNTWSSGNGVNSAPDISSALARELGAHLAIVGYRDSVGTTWPEPIQDISTAVRFLKTRAAEFNIDADRIILAGDQAGAHLAGLSAVSSGIQEFVGDDYLSETNRVAAFIGLGGVYDFDTLSADAVDIEFECGALPTIAADPVKRLFDCPDALPGADPLSACDPVTLTEASPVFHVSSDDPPVVTAHGGADCVVPSRQSVRFDEVLASRAVDSTFTLIAEDDEFLDSLTASDLELQLATILPCD